MKSNYKKLSLFLTIILIFMASCTAHVHSIDGIPDANRAGFLLGLWHGVIAPFSFIASLFSDTIAIYEINNNGGWYDFGFLLGIGTFLGGSSKGSGKIRSKN